MRERVITNLAVALSVVATGALAGCGEKDEPDLGSLPASPSTTSAPETTSTEPTGPGETEQPGGAETALRSQAEHAVQAYITWIDRGQGGRLCKLIDADALEQLPLPVRQGTCGAALSNSIGYRSRRGRPVFEGVQLRELSVRVRGRVARAVATVSVHFADRPAAAAVEDDVIYLVRKAGHWLIAKPSGTLYRAVGAEVSPAALAPPRGS